MGIEGSRLASRVELSDDEQGQVEQLKAALAQIRSDIAQHRQLAPGRVAELGRIAHELHMSLASRDHEPRHRGYMIENRRCKPRDPHFYEHIHPVEDLLGFIADEHANDDPKDQTVGVEFDFPVYSRRWGHDDTYKIRRTATGWTFRHLQEATAGRDGRKAGKPGTGLFALLDHDSINYPAALPGYLEWLWDQAAEQGLSLAEVQTALSELAAWVSVCEQSSPVGVFEGFK